jgi:hypothetical protein
VPEGGWGRGSDGVGCGVTDYYYYYCVTRLQEYIFSYLSVHGESRWEEDKTVQRRDDHAGTVKAANFRSTLLLDGWRTCKRCLVPGTSSSWFMRGCLQTLSRDERCLAGSRCRWDVAGGRRDAVDG